MNIVKAATNYAKEICDLLIRSITEICGPDYNNDPNTMKNWLANKTPDNVASWINNSNDTFIALSQDNKVIGVILMNNTGEILLNYLLPEYLQKGIGKALLKKVEHTAREKSISILRARSTITARKFYQRNGFILSNDSDSLVEEHCPKEYPLEKYLN